MTSVDIWVNGQCHITVDAYAIAKSACSRLVHFIMQWYFNAIIDYHGKGFVNDINWVSKLTWNLGNFRSSHYIASVTHRISSEQKHKIVSMHVGCIYKYICDFKRSISCAISKLKSMARVLSRLTAFGKWDSNSVEWLKHNSMPEWLKCHNYLMYSYITTYYVSKNQILHFSAQDII